MARMKSWLAFGLCVLCARPLASLADEAGIDAPPPESAAVWLGHITGASQRLNYVGTFSYQVGRISETSRIVHRFADGNESERLEVLDGSPREVIRKGNEVRCLLPKQRTMIVSRVEAGEGFPGRLPRNYAKLVDVYNISEGGADRVAGHEARKVVLSPKDSLRFGHVLWAEAQSGLLLKSQVIDGNEVVEQFTFNDVRIGGEIGDELLQAQVKPGKDWRVVDARSDEVETTENRWRLKEPLPGFTLTSTHQRRNKTVHMLFSDGLAAISVFIEPLESGSKGEPPKGRGFSSGGGAVNAFERIADGQRITVLGEAPAPAVQRLAEMIEPARE
ncbi:MAG: MucB/RseB C-terminal domain-containing protein [Azoarcus sp.]|jgi:sigma-E factor negative regulatory protein RseB|nr:MucB/RseB C-terminal domain-containing protein [Azoarcus sp.]